jgi:hypothetical protein
MLPDATYQVRTHLVYEVKWLVYAALRVGEQRAGDPYVALLDSAAVHGRNLFEFMNKGAPTRFTLVALEGTRQVHAGWEKWANNRVMHMLRREVEKCPYPDGIDDRDPLRLCNMAATALDLLAHGGEAIPTGEVRDWYFAVVAKARAYLDSRVVDGEAHAALAALYDASRDGRPYNDGGTTGVTELHAFGAFPPEGS